MSVTIPIANLAAANRVTLQAGPNLVLRGRPNEGYYVGIDLAKLDAKRENYGEAFNVVIFGDLGNPNDFYVLPYAAIGHLFARTPIQLRSAERPRWKVQIHSDEMAVAGMDQRLNVAEFYADFAATQQGSRSTDNLDMSVEATIFETQRAGVVTQRRGQDCFHREVLYNFGHGCCLTGVTERELLVASHIVPWSRRVPPRLDPANGLCLFVAHDKLFDKGYFTVSDDLTISTTRQRARLSSHVVRLLDEIDCRTLCQPLRWPIRPEYLRFHRQHVFLK
jgi:putative restriction endonuclease